MSERAVKTHKPRSETSPSHVPSQTSSQANFITTASQQTSEGIMRLQGVIGNRAVQRLLVQREGDGVGVAEAPAPEEVADNPLTAAQVVKARSFYAGRPDLYTATIISQIQTEVGVDATGKVTDEMIQAVARFQRDEGTLAVDGMAGPRTLPAAFPSGLAEDENKENFAEDVETLQGDWKDLKTPEDRINKIVSLINEGLEASKVHPVSHEFADTGAANASFNFRKWEIKIGRKKFEGDIVSDEEMTKIAGTIYHEARHAEQWYRIAQLLAGQKRTAAQIATETEIDADAIAAAFKDPIQPGTMEAVIAQGWYDSVYGKDSSKRDAVLTEVLAAKTALVKANDELAKNPTPENTTKQAAAQARFDKAYIAYKNLPEEADAHRVGDELEALVSAELKD